MGPMCRALRDTQPTRRLSQALVLTSHRDYAQALREELASLGLARVDVELDALRALQLRPQAYALIIIDVVLEAMDGLQLLLLFRQQAPAAIFVMVGDDALSRAAAMKNGADLFLERPRDAMARKVAVGKIRALLESVRPDAAGAEPAPLAAIADLIETSCLSGDSVLLQVHHEKESGDIFIHNGNVFHAQYPGRSGTAAFYDIVNWNGGMLEVRSLKINHLPPRTIEAPYRDLLREAAAGDLLPGGEAQPPDEAYVSLAGGTTVDSFSDFLNEAPPLEEEEKAAIIPFPKPEDAALINVHAHWKVDLTGALVESAKGYDPDHCAFITSFIYRKLADVAVALELDYFEQITLWGGEFQQVLVADNLGVRHGIFESARTTETQRNEYVKWCRERGV